LAPWQREDLAREVEAMDELSAEALAALRGKPAIYHCVTRVVNREFVLGEEEKEHFVSLMRLYERFCRVRVLTFVVMSNHFHLLLEVPARPEERWSDEDLLAHLGILYSTAEVKKIRAELEHFRDLGAEDAAEALREKHLGRMYDLSAYMKIVKQRFTQWFNGRRARKGTLWEERFKSTWVEDGHAARVVAAYIDLNAVRAGLVRDPTDYRWCGYGEAVAGRMPARAGLQRVVFEKFSTLTSEARAAQMAKGWREVGRAYRQFLFLDGRAPQPEKEGGTRRKGVKTFSEKQVQSVLKAGGKLSELEMLRCRARYVADGLVFGTRSFLNATFRLTPEWFSAGRKDGARKIRGVETELCTMRDLQRRALG
jgi:hypothetical protein